MLKINKFFSLIIISFFCFCIEDVNCADRNAPYTLNKKEAASQRMKRGVASVFVSGASSSCSKTCHSGIICDRALSHIKDPQELKKAKALQVKSVNAQKFCATHCSHRTGRNSVTGLDEIVNWRHVISNVCGQSGMTGTAETLLKFAPQQNTTKPSDCNNCDQSSCNASEKTAAFCAKNCVVKNHDDKDPIIQCKRAYNAHETKKRQSIPSNATAPSIADEIQKDPKINTFREYLPRVKALADKIKLNNSQENFSKNIEDIRTSFDNLMNQAQHQKSFKWDNAMYSTMVSALKTTFSKICIKLTEKDQKKSIDCKQSNELDNHFKETVEYLENITK